MTDIGDSIFGYAHVDTETSVEEIIAEEQSEVEGEFEASQVIGDTKTVGFIAIDTILSKGNIAGT